MIETHDSVIVQTVCRQLIPLIQRTPYIVFFGQYSPGGGFAAGVILGAAFVLAILVFGVDCPEGRAMQNVLRLDGAGLVIFAGVGGLCLIGGGTFLNYSTLQIPGVADSARHSIGIVLTQIGVALDCAVTALSIVFSLGSIAHDGAAHD